MIEVFLLYFNELGFGLGLFLDWVVETDMGCGGSKVDMGCGGSKVDGLPLVIRCRERKELLRAAGDHRYALASAHVSYFRSLKDIGDALRKFVDEELVIASPLDSPVLSLPSDEGKSKKKKNIDTRYSNRSGRSKKSSSSDTSMSHSGSISHVHSVQEDDDDDHAAEDSHLNLSSDLETSGHIHMHDSDGEDEGPNLSPLPHTDWGPYGMNQPPQTAWGPYEGMNQPPQTDWDPYRYGMNQESQNWGPYGGNSTSYAHYMKSSAPAARTVIHEAEPQRSAAETSYVYSSSYPEYSYGNGGFFGFPMSSPSGEPSKNRQPSPPRGPPPPPSPKVSSWDFLNPFDVFDNGYPGYFSQKAYGYGSVVSSPDSNEVREREGIPDLEEETENEVYENTYKGKKVKEDVKISSSEGSGAVPSQKSERISRPPPSKSSQGNLREVPSHSSEDSSWEVPSAHNLGTSRAAPPQNSEGTGSVNVKEEKSSPDIVSTNTEDRYARKKGVSFDIEDAWTHDVESLKLSSLTTISAHGTRDLQEVVREIKDEFEIASSYGKEVALMLEVGKLPYQPRFTKEIFSRILYFITPSLSSSHPPSRQSARLASKAMKLAKSYYEETGKDIFVKPINLSSTLEKLYAWEKKLYKEVKDEERLRVIYEKQCKKLKDLDDRGAESSKIDATRASIRKLLTKLGICIKAIDAISSRIHKLRDEELQPQITELIQGLTRMWESMLKCHQKQFQAIMDSKTRTLRANIGSRKDSSLRATVELEMELHRWCHCLNDWIHTQKSYIVSLNGWLLQCLDYEPEETPDGIVPFSPGRIGAPPVFIICYDWKQAMETFSEAGVADAMRNFASNLRRLWERQDEEQRQKLKAEYISKDFEKRLRTLRMERGRMERHQDAMSEKSGSIVPSESEVSAKDDLKVDLDSIKGRLAEERARHKDAMKLVHDAASSSVQGGLIPIFKALEDFTSEALKAHEQVRIQKNGRVS
ncbi:unnamed protein product [Ilex paraguariensis]|uniref:DUF632 domain-containing protein n=1 Tax=Ilex paraguariensis TaxID=185542 RepID=A0ABC8RD81_9AQUA